MLGIQWPSVVEPVMSSALSFHPWELFRCSNVQAKVRQKQIQTQNRKSGHFQGFWTAMIVLSQPLSSPELSLFNQFSQRSGKLIHRMIPCKIFLLSTAPPPKKKDQEEASGLAQGLMLNQLQNRKQVSRISLYSPSKFCNLRIWPIKFKIFQHSESTASSQS